MDESAFDSVETERHKPVWAQIVSDIFSPVMMPVFAMVVAMWCTDLCMTPLRARLTVTLLVALIASLAPFLAIVALIRAGRVHTRSIANPRERFLPMAVAAVCYLGAALFLRSAHAPSWLSMFFVGAAAATLVAMLITRRWKISAHTTAAGGFAGMTFWLTAGGLTGVGFMTVLSAAVIIAGLVATSRLMLRRHTFSQVTAGLALGFICVFGLMYI